MVHFSTSSGSYWTKHAQKLGGWALMAVTHFFWSNKARFIAHTDSLEAWPEALGKIIAEKSITDIVLYGDTRPLHAEAIKLAKGLGLRIHVFEEGYLRPYWVNYERGGSNGNSRLMGMTVERMQKVLRKARIDLTEAPAHWGDIRQHAFYSFVYHLNILLNNRAFPRFQSHRTESVAHEFLTYLRRLLLHPIDIVKRQISTRPRAHRRAVICRGYDPIPQMV